MTDLGKMRSIDIDAAFKMAVDKGTIPATIPTVNFTDFTVGFVRDDGYQWVVGESIRYRDGLGGEWLFTIDHVAVTETADGDVLNLNLSGTIREKGDE